jgi:hypothetical protein
LIYWADWLQLLTGYIINYGEANGIIKFYKRSLLRKNIFFIYNLNPQSGKLNLENKIISANGTTNKSSYTQVCPQNSEKYIDVQHSTGNPNSQPSSTPFPQPLSANNSKFGPPHVHVYLGHQLLETCTGHHPQLTSPVESPLSEQVLQTVWPDTKPVSLQCPYTEPLKSLNIAITWSKLI